MKYIAKRKKHVDCLYDEHQTPPSTSEEAQRRWNRFNGKTLLTEVLNDEQYNLCAYTELRPDEEGIGTHIEHVKPKSKFPAATFDYKNLVLSSLESDDLAKPHHQGDHFGGHAKGSHYDRKQFLIPLIARSKRNYFLYQSDGKVVPSPLKSKRYQRKAEHTIRLLNLNAAYLVNHRKRWIEEVDKLIDDHLEQDMSLPHLASVDLIPVNNKLSRFFTATRQRFGRIAENVLKEQAPELL